MESVEAVAAKRRVLIDALMMCLGKSRVVQVVDAKTVRGVIDSASGELWREGEFRLDPVWKLLINQPGLSAEEVAPPLLSFKAYEGELGVQVRLPQALSAIPRGEQVRLRDALGVQRQDFQRAIEEMRALVAQQALEEKKAQLLREAASTVDEPTASGDTTRQTGGAGGKATATQKRLAALLSLAAIVAISVGAWLGLRDTARGFDLGDVAGTLQLANGKAAGGSLTATIVDPKWDSASADERRKLASQLLDIEAAKGIKVLTLLDGSGATRALVTDGPDGRAVILQ